MQKGKALKLSDSKIEAEAQVTPQKLDVALRWWRQVAPGPFRTLLDSQPTDKGHG